MKQARWFYVLLALVVALDLGDVVTTLAGVSMGASERNAAVAPLLAQHAAAVWLTHKALALAAFAAAAGACYALPTVLHGYHRPLRLFALAVVAATAALLMAAVAGNVHVLTLLAHRG